MNTKEFVQEYSRRIGANPEVANQHIKCMLGLIVEGTRRGKRVDLGGFGKFYRFLNKDGGVSFKFAPSSALKDVYWQQWEEGENANKENSE